MLQNTDLVSHRKPEKKRNPYYSNKYNFGKRVLPDRSICYTERNEKNHNLKVATDKFLKDQISPDEYKDLLRKEGINPEVDAISKNIRDKANGSQIKYSDLYAIINIHKNDTIPSQPQFKHRGLAEDDGKINSERLMVARGDKL